MVKSSLAKMTTEYLQSIEFDEWVESMETKIKLAVTKKTKIVLHKNDTEEYSPYITINS